MVGSFDQLVDVVSKEKKKKNINCTYINVCAGFRIQKPK